MLEKQMKTAQHAVAQAMRISRTVQRELAGDDCITKKDKSPVTVADFAVQAIVCRILAAEFPAIPIVGEERSDALKKTENRGTMEKILHYINADPKIADTINDITDAPGLFGAIDLGGAEPNMDSFWTLDPVDGTKGFLRKGQFAVALALIREGKVQLGVLGCPNLDSLGTNHPATSAAGFMFTALRGQGTRIINGETGETTDARVSTIADAGHMCFVESHEAGHGNQGVQLEIARSLGIVRDSVRMDSQVKYGMVAAGAAEIYLRVPNPKSPDYREKIWDHAAGSLVVEEAGGVVSDITGKPLDFSAGKTLQHNRGVIACVPPVHQKIADIANNILAG